MVPRTSHYPFLPRLLLSVGALSVFILLALALQPLLLGGSLALFLAAVTISSLFGGLLVGIIIAILATLAHSFFFQEPLYQFTVTSQRDVAELLIFLAMAIFMSWLGSSYRKSLIAAELERHAREDLLAIVSHDLRNPLVAIQLNSQLVRKLFSDSLPPEADKRLNSIEETIGQMNRLIQHLQDYEKFRAGTFEIHLQSQSVDSLLEQAASLLRPIAEAKEIALSVSCAQTGLFALCDRERVLQVLSNLAGNALKFTARGGMVSIHAEKDGGEILFRVRDNGPGIAEDQLSLIFDRYWQARETSRYGTGLGLGIARGIVQAHGGRIWATSKLGEGSSLFFTLKSA
ncbi:MAG: sensor histidine kinase [Bdellovibrionota bacterium]